MPGEVKRTEKNPKKPPTLKNLNSKLQITTSKSIDKFVASGVVSPSLTLQLSSNNTAFHMIDHMVFAFFKVQGLGFRVHSGI
jgi:hypothetical protein